MTSQMLDEKSMALNAEVQRQVQRLLDASIVREVKYPRWLANVVVVRKEN